MNIIRTIQASEEQWWIDELFQPTGRPDGPAFPIRLPFPHRLLQAGPGEMVYVSWQGKIVGFAPIADIIRHAGDTVGTSENPVSGGDSVIVKIPFTRWGNGPRCRGFQGVRYVGNIHLMSAAQAQTAVDSATGT